MSEATGAQALGARRPTLSHRSRSDHFHLHSQLHTIATPCSLAANTRPYTRQSHIESATAVLKRHQTTPPDRVKRPRDCVPTRQNQQNYKESKDGAQQGKGRKSGVHRQHPIRSVHVIPNNPRQPTDMNLQASVKSRFARSSAAPAR